MIHHNKRRPRRWLRYCGWSLLAGVLLVGGLWLFCPKPRLYDTSFSTALFDREGGLLRLTTATDDRYRLFTPLDAIAPVAVEATLLYEDAYFYWHPGVNPVSLLEAAWTTYITRERKIGGSTISMQLARLRFDLDSSSPGGKLVQILRALQLERHYDKNTLLEAYLNLAPYGGNVEGIGTASRVYFHKPASELTTLEALTLAVIPQNPNDRQPQPGGEPLDLVKARARLLALWQEEHPRDQDLQSRATTRLPVHAITELPFRAPHFVRRILTNDDVKSGRLYTTLSPGLQAMAENTVRDYLAGRQASGLNNAAVLIVDARDTSVRALVGSADWFNNAIDGQVNGTAARRSPGSALKPFIYALALDQGLIHPMTLMEDAPVRYAAYTPENFDQGFMGPISARDALIYSRNVPALSLAARLEQPDFYRFLKYAGIGNMQPRGFYGLAIALGGIEVTMEDMAELYAALGNGGTQRSLAFLQKQARERPGKPLFTPEAAFITLEMLAHNPQPGTGSLLRKRATYIPWKTGTSSGFRDAWSVGLVGPYVVAVWVGNFDGEGNPALVGLRAAAPLFFRLADALRARGVKPIRHKPLPHKLNVRKVAVCAPTGDLPNQYCPGTAKSWFIPGVSPIKVSDIYRPVRINPTTGRRACPGYSGPVETRVYEFWPSNLLQLFRRAGLPRRTPPPFAAGCSLSDTATTGAPPRILRPQPTVTYTLRPGKLEEERLPLQATADADAQRLFWFIDGQYLGHSEPDEILFWQPRPGRYTVRVVDDLGRVDESRLRVRLLSVSP